MKPRVYIETTIIGYLASRPQRDIVIAGHQQVTHEWWDTQRQDYDLCTSELVIDEISAGDPVAAGERLLFVSALSILEIKPQATVLAKTLLSQGALPSNAAADALHIAIAATHAIPFLLTWNCRHIANAIMRPVIESVCKKAGLQAPILCTPEELMETQS